MQKLIPHFQPIIDTWEKINIGYEATVKGLKMESARNLFRKAFEKGETIQLDQMARKQAIEIGLPLLKGEERLFLNISPQSVAEVHHNDWWGRGVDTLPFDKLVLEITESAPVNVEKFRKSISSLQEKGLGIALDDFGKGFANYEFLAKLGKIEYLKLDKLFVTHINKPRFQNVVKHIIRMAQDFETINGKTTKVIVEGVEREWQVQELHNLGVRYMQGFLFGYPETISYYQNEIESVKEKQDFI